MLSTAQEVPDVQVTVTSCYVEADILCNEWGGQEKLQSGLGDLVVVAAVSKKQVDMLLSVLPCPDAVCYTLPVQLERVGGESFKLPHVLFQHTSVDKMPVGLGKQTVPLVEICWQLTLRQCHWEWSAHLQLHRIGAGLCMCCKNVLRHFQHYLVGWPQSDVIKGMQNSSWHFAELEGIAAYCQADNCNIGHVDIQSSKRYQQLFVLTSQQCGLVLVELGADSEEGLVAGQESIQTGLVHLTRADPLALLLVAHDHQLPRFRQADLNKLECVL